MSEEEENIVINMGAPDWVVTFGDLMSLLLCFFVLLLSFSEMDKAKYKEVAGSLAKAFGVQRQTKSMTIPKGISMVAKDFDQTLVPVREKDEFVAMARRKEVGEELKKEIEKSLREMEEKEGKRDKDGEDKKEGMKDEDAEDELAGIDKLIGVEVGENEVSIRMMGETAFDSGKAEIRREMVPLLNRISAVLRKHEGEITVVGHTDNVPLMGGAFETNLGLSMARAASVAHHMLNEGRIQPKRLSTMGFGEHRPIDTNDTAEGRQKNRRVEIKLKSPPID